MSLKDHIVFECRDDPVKGQVTVRGTAAIKAEYTISMDLIQLTNFTVVSPEDMAKNSITKSIYRLVYQDVDVMVEGLQETMKKMRLECRPEQFKTIEELGLQIGEILKVIRP